MVEAETEAEAGLDKALTRARHSLSARRVDLTECLDLRVAPDWADVFDVLVMILCEGEWSRRVCDCDEVEAGSGTGEDGAGMREMDGRAERSVSA